MTVADLIAELQKMPQDAEVYIVERGEEGYHDEERAPREPLEAETVNYGQRGTVQRVKL